MIASSLDRKDRSCTDSFDSLGCRVICPAQSIFRHKQTRLSEQTERAQGGSKTFSCGFAFVLPVKEEGRTVQKQTGPNKCKFARPSEFLAECDRRNLDVLGERSSRRRDPGNSSSNKRQGSEDRKANARLNDKLRNRNRVLQGLSYLVLGPSEVCTGSLRFRLGTGHGRTDRKPCPSPAVRGKCAPIPIPRCGELDGFAI